MDWQVARRLWAGSLPMALIVVLAVTLGSSFGRVDWLSKAVGVVVVITAVGLLLAPKLRSLATTSRLNKPESFKKLQPGLTVAGGGALGLCVALTSVGAGALGSVMLLYLYPLRMTPHRLVATDLVHAIPLAVVAGLGYLAAGLVDWNMLLSLLCGSVPAIIVGSLLARKVSGRWLQVLLSLVLLGAGAKALA